MAECPDCGSAIEATAKICLCGWKPAAKPYRAEPTKMPDYADVEQKFLGLRRNNNKRKFRSVFLPGESFTDYMTAMENSGKSKEEFDAERLRMNGF